MGAGADLDVPEVPGGTHPLSLALLAKVGKLELLRCLVEGGANLDLPSNGSPVLHKAVAQGDLAAVQLLVEAGAALENVVDRCTPLTYSAQQGNSLEVVDYLIRAGADVNGTREHTPLVKAARFGHLGVMRCLIAAGADLEKAPKGGCTPLSIAAKHGQVGD